MWLLHPLEDILSSPAKVAILRTLCRTPGPLSGRETIRRAGTTYGPGWGALQDLVASGVLSKRDLGRASAYELREPDGPLILRLRELFDTEEERREQIVGELIAEIDDALTIILYGSEARGDAEAGSDTDVLIVVERKTDERLPASRTPSARMFCNGPALVLRRILLPNDARKLRRSLAAGQAIPRLGGRRTAGPAGLASRRVRRTTYPGGGPLMSLTPIAFGEHVVEQFQR